MTWATAGARGLLIVLYLVVATVWLPDQVLGLGFVEDASSIVRDLVLVIVWGSALGVGMYLLRVGQRRGLI